MPVVKIDWAEGRTDEQKKEVITGVTDLISKTLDIDKSRVTVLINDLPKANVGVGGKVMSEKK